MQRLSRAEGRGRLGHGFLIIHSAPQNSQKDVMTLCLWWWCWCFLMIPRGGRWREEQLYTGTHFISRRALSSTDKVTCTPRVLIPSNSSPWLCTPCMLSGCPCVCVCVHASIPVPVTPWSVLYSMHLFRVSVSCLPPHHCLYWHRPPSLPRTVFLSCPMAISSVCLCSFPSLPFHSSLSSLLFSPPLSLFFLSFLLLYHPLPLSPPPPFPPLFFLSALSLSACLYINISLQHCPGASAPITPSHLRRLARHSRHLSTMRAGTRPGCRQPDSSSCPHRGRPPPEGRRAPSLAQENSSLPPTPQNLGPHF